jgi:LysM repeat protein
MQSESKPIGDFEHWLRTGRVRRPMEFKFNGWHDADDGKFTHVGAGRYFPPGSRAAPKPRPSGSGKRAAPAYTVHDPRHPNNYSVVQVRRGDTLTKLAESRRGLTVSDLAWLNQLDPKEALQIGQPIKVPLQSFLERGRDARNRFLALAYYMDKHGGQLPPDVANPPSLDQQLADERTRVVANGYEFDRDGLNRTREVMGALRLNPKQGRSRSAQAEAGASDRRPTDEGGHIIARRFNGPKDAFNHFAQDRTFNRGDYRGLENRLARLREQGTEVTIEIQLLYKEKSSRPYKLRFGYMVKDQYVEETFPNGTGE